MNTYYCDVSYREHIKEFNTPCGWLKAVTDDGVKWRIYKSHNGLSYMFDTVLEIRSKPENCRDIYSKWFNSDAH